MSSGSDAPSTAATAKTLADMGGFLGLGATRKHLTSDQVQDVQRDRIVVRVSEADAAAEDSSPAQRIAAKSRFSVPHHEVEITFIVDSMVKVARSGTTITWAR
jgi:hypothetical protein